MFSQRAKINFSLPQLRQRTNIWSDISILLVYQSAATPDSRLKLHPDKLIFDEKVILIFAAALPKLIESNIFGLCVCVPQQHLPVWAKMPDPQLQPSSHSMWANLVLSSFLSSKSRTFLCSLLCNHIPALWEAHINQTSQPTSNTELSRELTAIGPISSLSITLM